MNPHLISIAVSAVFGFVAWLLKRAIDAKEARLVALESEQARLKRICNRLLVDVAVLKSQTTIDLHNLERLESKLDRLIESDCK